MASSLKKEFHWYLEHQADLVKRYNGRYVVIKGQQVIGDYEDQATAVAETSKAHKLGTFLVQKVEPGTDAYTQSFYSRVTFQPSR